MDKIGVNVKRLLLAGLGTVATTAEKSKEIVDGLVEKGELTFEQGKSLNSELKHNVTKTVRQKVKDNFSVNVVPENPEDLTDIVDVMTKEQLEALKNKIAEVESKAEEVVVEAEEVVEDVEEEATEE